MNTGKARFVCDDGVELAYHWWLPDAGEPAKVLALLHGIALEGSPYQGIGRPLSEAGTAVYSLDLRGHGESGGAPGDMGKNRDVLEDIEAFLSVVRARHADAPVYLFGESMGGLFALAFAAAHQQGLSGLILAAPALRLRLGRFFSRSTLELPCYVVACRRPFLKLNGKLLDISCRDEWFKHYRRTDPRPLPAVSVCYLWRVGTFMAGWCFRYARRLRTPTLIVQGAHDDVFHPAGVHRLFDAIHMPDKELIVLGDAWHTLPWDLATPVLVDAMMRWLARH